MKSTNVPFRKASTRRTPNNVSHTRTQAVPKKSTGEEHEHGTVKRPNGPDPQHLSGFPANGRMPQRVKANSRQLGTPVSMAGEERGRKWTRETRSTNDLVRRNKNSALTR